MSATLTATSRAAPPIFRFELHGAEVGGAYEGPDDIRRYFADLGDTSPDFHLTIERLEPVGLGRVLGLLRVTARGRASGIPAASETPTALIYDLVDGKIRRIRIFLDRDQALEAAGLQE
jgi:SnoaL-like protein